MGKLRARKWDLHPPPFQDPLIKTKALRESFKGEQITITVLAIFQRHGDGIGKRLPNDLKSQPCPCVTHYSFSALAQQMVITLDHYF